MSIQQAFQQAHALHGQGRLDEAIPLYRAIIRAAPRHADAHHFLGLALLQSGDAAAAEVLLGKAIRLNPKDAEAHANLAMAYRSLGRLDDAARAYARAIAAKPDFAEAYFHRGVVLEQSGRLDDALTAFNRAAELRPDWAPAAYNAGNILHRFGRLAEAEARFTTGLTLDPNLARAWNNRGLVWMRQNRLEEALADHRMAASLAPGDADLILNCCAPLIRLGRLEEVRDACNRALAIDPGNARAHLGLGMVFEDRGDTASALAEYDTALALEPSYGDALWNRALLLLKTGMWPEGWRAHEIRLGEPGPTPPRDFPKPRWLGEGDIAGKTLLLHWEQGFGDTIQFARFALLAEQRGARVVVSVQTPLIRLMRRLSPGITIIGEDDTPKAFDLHTPLMSLPLAFGVTVETIPAFAAYLSAEPDDVAGWLTAFPRNGRPCIGLAWSGNPEHLNDRNRSLPLARLLAALPDDADYICVQKDISDADLALLRADGRVRVVSHDLRDFADTAALMATLDLVISVDTSLAHLAGALGRPVWVLLPFNPDWRWLLGRSDSPWYPSARLFRQHRVADWDSALADVAAALRDHAFGQDET